MSKKSLASLLVILMATMAFANLSCLNRQGQPVSWFTALRYPGNLTTSNVRYAYLDATSGSAFQVVQGVNIDDSAEPLAKTIDTINALTGSNKNLLVLTNVPPNGTLFNTGAHAKAIVAFDNQTQTGVYIMHTFLSYPDVASDGTINSTVPLDGNEYAQDNGPDGNYVYCVSFNQELLSVIVSQLPNEQPDLLYTSGIFANLPVDPNFDYEIQPFHLTNGDFQWFITKGPSSNMNMYDDIIANQFGVNLAVNTPGGQPPDCPPNMTVVNVQSININSQDTWPIADDNSKYAIGILATLPSVYFCDNDRDPAQNTRGGSCFASSNLALYAAFQNILTYNNTCPNSTMIEDIISI